LNERESSTGTRNLTIYHTAGNKPVPIKDQSSEISTDIYTFTTIEKPIVQGKNWDEVY